MNQLRKRNLAGRITGACFSLLLALPLAVAAQTPPANDDFANRILLTGYPAGATGSNVGATTEAGEPLINQGDGATVWWTWVSPLSGPVSVLTGSDGGDLVTVIALYTGASLNELVLLTNSAELEHKVTFDAVAGNDYQIQIAGHLGQEGGFFLFIETPPANDDFADRAVLSGLPVAATGPNAGATLEVGEPTPPAANSGTVWWSWTSPITGLVTIDCPGGFLAVYTGDSLDSLVLQGSLLANQTSFTLSVVAGTTYQIQVAEGGADVSFQISPYSRDAVFEAWLISVTNLVSPALVADQSDNFIISGLRQTNNTALPWIGKFGQNGQLLWQETYVDPSSIGSMPLSVATDSSNNVIVVGTFQTVATTTNITVLKYSPAGSLLWSRQFGLGLTTNLAPTALAVSSNGAVTIAGNAAAVGGSPVWLVFTYDAGGNLLWTAGGPATNALQGLVSSLTEDAAGNVLVAGSAASGANLLKYDPAGSLFWQHTEVAANFSLVRADSSGNVYLGCGYGGVPGDPNIEKLDPQGNSLWLTTYVPTYPGFKGIYSSSDLAMALDAAGDVYLAGVPELYPTTYNPYSGAEVYDAKLASQDGSLEWSGSAPWIYPLQGSACAIALDQAGRLFVSGSSNTVFRPYNRDAFTDEYDASGSLIAYWKPGLFVEPVASLVNSSNNLAILSVIETNVFLEKNILSPPVLSSAPSTQSVTDGALVTFAVQASGYGLPLQYQWQFNGTDIPGATNAVLSLPPAAAAQIGAYSVRAFDAAGASSCATALLAVDGLGPSYLTAPLVLSGGALQFTAVGVPGLKYGLYGSTNLLNWTFLQTFTNLTGSLPLQPSSFSAGGSEFFRLQSGP